MKVKVFSFPYDNQLYTDFVQYLISQNVIDTKTNKVSMGKVTQIINNYGRFEELLRSSLYKELHKTLNFSWRKFIQIVWDNSHLHNVTKEEILRDYLRADGKMITGLNPLYIRRHPKIFQFLENYYPGFEKFRDKKYGHNYSPVINLMKMGYEGNFPACEKCGKLITNSDSLRKNLQSNIGRFLCNSCNHTDSETHRKINEAYNNSRINNSIQNIKELYNIFIDTKTHCLRYETIKKLLTKPKDSQELFENTKYTIKQIYDSLYTHYDKLNKKYRPEKHCETSIKIQSLYRYYLDTEVKSYKELTDDIIKNEYVNSIIIDNEFVHISGSKLSENWLNKYPKILQYLNHRYTNDTSTTSLKTESKNLNRPYLFTIINAILNNKNSLPKCEFCGKPIINPVLEHFCSRKCYIDSGVGFPGAKKYYYDNKIFDSSWEIIYYLYAKQIKKIHIIRNNSFSLSYEVKFENKITFHSYFPDFIINPGKKQKFIEVKGSHMLNDKNELVSFYSDKPYELEKVKGKQKCMDYYKVIVIGDESEIKKYVAELDAKFGKNYIDKFEIVKNEDKKWVYKLTNKLANI